MTTTQKILQENPNFDSVTSKGTRVILKTNNIISEYEFKYELVAKKVAMLLRQTI